MSTAKLTAKQNLWERKLLDFSLRNNLINLKSGKKVIQFMTFNPENIENILQSGADFSVSFFTESKPEPANGGLYDSQKQFADKKEEICKLYGQKKLLSFMTEAELGGALKYLYRSARTAMEENGSNSLFLAIGIVKWFEQNKNTQPHYAPLLLLPVSIVRKSIQNGYIIRARDEQILLNITLTQMLKQQFGVDIPFKDALPEDEHGVDVRQIFTSVKQTLSVFEQWEVLEETVLGLFSFNKFVMWSDIHYNSDMLAGNDIIRSLAENKILWQDTDSDIDIRQTDKTLPPKDIAVPLDVDSSQLEAIIAASEGRSFVLHGPPGTGKSQTIANMIANALYHNKRVLFVAEKMAALSVVQRRLEKIGLAPFCLELHSNKVSKTHFLSQMQKALDVAHTASSKEFEKKSEEIFAMRKELIHLYEALHTKHESGWSLHGLIEQYCLINQEECPYGVDVSGITSAQVSQWLQEKEKINTVLQVLGNLSDHPLKGLYYSDNGKETFDSVTSALQAFNSSSDFDKKCSNFANLMQYADKACICGGKVSKEDIEATEKYCKQRLQATQNITPQFKEAILQLDADTLSDRWAKAKSKMFLTRFFAKKSFLKTLKPYGNASQENVEELLNNLLLYNQADKALKANSQTTENVFELLKEKCGMWLQNTHLMKDWYLWTEKKSQYASSPFATVLQITENGQQDIEQSINAFLKKVFALLIGRIIENDAALRSFNGLVTDSVIKKYRQQSKAFQQLTVQALYCKLAMNVPNQTMQAVASSEMGILKRNIMSSGRGNSVRSILDSIPQLIQKLCPCMLMSPISVAQYLNKDCEKFDLVIFDEASQMPASEAVGAIARGKALVVVGDPEQMPPTNFFAASQTDETDAQNDDMESILDDCISLSMPSYYLSWHYRSKHESLIAFSNAHYYDNKLLTFPSVDDRISKVTLVKTQSTYDKGKSRSNKTEAQAVVEEIVRRLSDKTLSQQSIGVVSFSKAQQDVIEDMLTERLAKDKTLEDRAFNSQEPVFIKNLENVQGDERDVILFSVGYGPDAEGKLSMNFGPLNNTGGERRLNVAVSRARYEMVVFSSVSAEQIDLNRSDAKGVQGLKYFLEYAQNGSHFSLENNKKEDKCDAIACMIAQELNAKGYNTVLNVGRSDFKIDIGVLNKTDSNKYITGILLDGSNYKKSKTVRDREIVQPSVLQSLSWNVMRVWTLDWYENKEKVIQNILLQLQQAENQASNPP
ncbi:MAG: DUF4011 domain-containing protein, partial [Bacteroidales bacterium]|nr:DUF4011 domain-containing protein [Bacteroidales bacterium]